MKRSPSPSPKPTFRNTRSKFFKHKQSDVSRSPPHEEKSGDYWKNKGNEAYAKGYYQTAIEHYTKAIQLNEGESIYYSNRAKCYRNLDMIEKALKDSEAACELNDQNIKAHYLCGCILADYAKKDDSKLTKAENRLKKALRLCDSLKKPQFIDQISIKLFRVRKLRYLKEEEQKDKHHQEMIGLIKKSHSSGLVNKQSHDLMLANQQKARGRKKLEIPDYLLCKITLEVMEEPITTEAGFSYEKSALEQHFHVKGFVEPLTRQPISEKVYPNQALKSAVQEFMEQNPWAYEFTEGQSYHDIKF